jgi:hypothetical protein
MAAIGMTNVTTMAISKGIAFVGGILLVAGMGGMALSNKCFTEAEIKYLTEHVNAK